MTPDALPAAAGRPRRPAHARGLALPVRGLLQGARARPGAGTASPLGRWSAAGYLRAATGPFAASSIGSRTRPGCDKIDLLVMAGLVLVGLSLMLGLFTQAGCVGAAPAAGPLLRLVRARPGSGAGGRRRGLSHRQQEPDRSRGGSRGPGASGPAASRASTSSGARARAPQAHGGARVMNLTPEQQELGRRNFLKAVATTPALAALGSGGALARGPVRGGPVRVGYVGPGRRRAACSWAQTDPAYAHGAGPLRHQPGPAAEGRRGAGQGGTAPGQALRRVEDDAGEGGPRGGHPRGAALDARRHHRRPAWRRASTSSARR